MTRALTTHAGLPVRIALSRGDGRTPNGRIEWLNPDGMTLKDIQERAIVTIQASEATDKRSGMTTDGATRAAAASGSFCLAKASVRILLTDRPSCSARFGRPAGCGG